MNVANFVGEIARPFSIIFLAVMMGMGLFSTLADVGKMTVVAGAFGVLIGARGWENIAKTKADSVDKQTKAGITPAATVGPNDQVVIQGVTPKKGKK